MVRLVGEHRTQLHGAASATAIWNFDCCFDFSPLIFLRNDQSDSSDPICQSQLFYQFTESQSQKPTSLVTRLPRRSEECGDDEIWPPIHADNRSNAPHNQRQGRRREPQRTASGTEIFLPAPLKPPSPTPQFLCYKKLKKCLKTIPKKTEPAKNADGTLKPGEKRKLTEEQRVFVKTLNAELQKFNKFFMDAEEDLVIKDSLLEQAYREVVNEDGTRAPRAFR